MRRIVLFLSFLLISISSFSQSEKISSFHADIEIKEDGTLKVSEKITYTTQLDGKRGIVRRLPTSRKDREGTSIQNDWQNITVYRDGAESPFHTENEGGKLVIYVGKSDIFLDPGTYHYEISYEIPYQIGFFEGYDELYWNVNGTDWDFIVEKISAQIQLPSGASTIQTSCYTGPYGSTAQNCRYEIKGDEVYFETTETKLGDNLSIAVGFTPGIISRPPPPSWAQRYGGQLLAAFIGLILLVYYGFTWHKFGIDPPKPTVIPLFDPPAGLSPASIAMVKKGYYWQDIATASLVNLAIKGYILIKDDTSKGFLGMFKNHRFILEMVKNVDEELPKEEKVILEKLFASHNRVELDGKYDSSIKKALDSFQKEIKQQWSSLIYHGLNFKFWIFPILVGITYFVLAISFQDYFVYEGKTILLILFCIANVLIFLVYQWLIRKPAERKLKLRAEIEGFEMYLGAAEERQLQHFNPPGMTPEIFEKYLPYAIALDVESVWGEKFEQFLKSSALAPSTYHPIWYNRPIASFGNFGHSLNSSLSNSLSSTASPPQQSGGWSGGSGGGGFSGGGGGGGGGGSW